MVGIFHGYVKWPDGIDFQMSQKDQLDENNWTKQQKAADNIFRHQWWNPPWSLPISYSSEVSNLGFITHSSFQGYGRRDI